MKKNKIKTQSNNRGRIQRLVLLAANDGKFKSPQQVHKSPKDYNRQKNKKTFDDFFLAFFSVIY